MARRRAISKASTSASSTPWTPVALGTSLIAWWDPANVAWPTNANGFSSGTDSSGNGHTLTIGSSYGPQSGYTFGGKVVQGYVDGNGRAFTVSFSPTVNANSAYKNGLTLVGFCRPFRQNSNNGRIWSASAGVPSSETDYNVATNFTLANIKSTTNAGISGNFNAHYPTLITSTSTPLPCIVVVTWSSTGVVNSYINGTQVVTAASYSNIPNFQTFAFAKPAGTYSGDYFNPGGLIGSTFLVGGEMTTTNRQKAEGYIANYYGISTSLPTSHPYYSSQPYV